MRDIHSFARPDEVLVRHLTLDLDVNFDARQLTGSATLSVVPQHGGRELVLDTNGLDIRRITLDDGTEAMFTMGDPTPFLGRMLTIAIKPETESVKIEYATAPDAAAVQWLTPEQTAGGKHPFLFTQSQAILARTWVPCQDTPGVRMTYDATIRVPKGLMAIMSAENPAAPNADGVYQFRMPQPIPSYLLALAVGDLEFRPFSDNSGVWAEKPMIDASQHELAHSWSGNLVTNATWNDFWLNEGFTVYFERRIMEEVFGREYSEMLALLGYQDLEATVAELPSRDTHLFLDLTDRDP
ncbi:MAG TPA: M1 family aminopeptidase/hydrolase, partial [Thermoanaerobaculia bacterium]